MVLPCLIVDCTGARSGGTHARGACAGSWIFVGIDGGDWSGRLVMITP